MLYAVTPATSPCSITTANQPQTVTPSTSGGAALPRSPAALSVCRRSSVTYREAEGRVSSHAHESGVARLAPLRHRRPTTTRPVDVPAAFVRRFAPPRAAAGAPVVFKEINAFDDVLTVLARTLIRWLIGLLLLLVIATCQEQAKRGLDCRTYHATTCSKRTDGGTSRAARE